MMICKCIYGIKSSISAKFDLPHTPKAFHINKLLESAYRNDKFCRGCDVYGKKFRYHPTIQCTKLK